MLKYFNLWVLATIALYYFGPIDWPGRSQWTVVLVVVPCLIAFNVGTFAGRMVEGGAVEPRQGYLFNRYVALGITLFFVVMTDLHLRQITGSTIFDPRSYSFEFGDVYTNFVETASAITNRGLGDVVFIITKGIVFTAVLLVLADSFPQRWLVVALAAFAVIGSSLLRGTDKEFIDFFIVFGALYYYKSKKRIKLRYPIALLVVVLFFFLERRIDRYGGKLPECIAGGDICIGYDTFLSIYVSPGLELLVAFLTNYIVQGYEALTLAYEQPFEWNRGIGHLPLLKRLFCSVMQVGCQVGDFQEKLNGIGWDTTVKWTSVYTVIANDFGWHLMPAYFLGLGFLFGVSETRWRVHRDVVSLAVLLLVTVFMVYASANMQLSISFDWLMPTLILFSLQSARAIGWLFGGVKTVQMRSRAT